MKAVFVLFDSLNLHALGAHGCTSIATPNFDRLAAKGVTFDNHYIGSMPCMPARREMHTGRLNFLHRSWGPLEPFDNSLIRQLRAQGTYTHMVTDHCHYWMEGGATYHTQYSSFDFIRGQEKDRWKAMVEPPLQRFREMYHPIQYSENDEKELPYFVNRAHIKSEAEFPLAKYMDSAFEFLDENREVDNWFLQLECFDPHEPFWAPDRFRKKREGNYNGPILDWPRYDKVRESFEEVEEVNNNYAALVEMCDEYFGRLLDYFDEHGLWQDTALILTTDHGYLLGEHDWWGKNVSPYYNEIANIPLIIYHPEMTDQAGTRREALTQTIDLMPTILDLFDLPPSSAVTGKSLLPHINSPNAPGHEAVLYGVFGGALNVTDGRYTYFLYPKDMANQEIYEYTLMPTHLNSFFSKEELQDIQLVKPFEFTEGIKLLQIPARKSADGKPNIHGIARETDTVLYDIISDPGQLQPINDTAVIECLEKHIRSIMQAHDAPKESYSRVGL